MSKQSLDQDIHENRIEELEKLPTNPINRLGKFICQQMTAQNNPSMEKKND